MCPGKKEGSECARPKGKEREITEKVGHEKGEVDRTALSNMLRWRSRLRGGTDHDGIPVSIREISKTGSPGANSPPPYPASC